MRKWSLFGRRVNLCGQIAASRYCLPQTFAECPQLDLICVPGGGGVNPLLTNADTLDFVRRQAAAARYVTAVCTGALVLGAAGLLKGRRTVTHWMSMDFLKAFGAIPVDERIKSRRLVVSSSPSKIPMFHNQACPMLRYVTKFNPRKAKRKSATTRSWPTFPPPSTIERLDQRRTTLRRQRAPPTLTRLTPASAGSATRMLGPISKTFDRFRRDG